MIKALYRTHAHFVLLEPSATAVVFCLKLDFFLFYEGSLSASGCKNVWISTHFEEGAPLN